MACLITALTRSANKNTTRKKNKQNQQDQQTDNKETQYLNVKAPSKQRQNAIR